MNVAPGAEGPAHNNSQERRLSRPNQGLGSRPIFKQKGGTDENHSMRSQSHCLLHCLICGDLQMGAGFLKRFT